MTIKNVLGAPLASGLVAASLLVFASAPALAQDPAPAGATVTSAGTDHADVVGKFGVGFMGVASVPLATTGGKGNVGETSVAAPTVGVRYWLQDRLGIDVGLGLGILGGSSSFTSGGTTKNTDQPGVFALALHGGVPIVLSDPGKHHLFEVVPELNVAFANQTIKDTSGSPTPAPDIKLSGLRIDIGARAGTEIYFGFIGLPKLALQASIGLYFNYTKYSGSQGDNSTSVSSTNFGTTVSAAPWAVFTNNISALYYFLA